MLLFFKMDKVELIKIQNYFISNFISKRKQPATLAAGCLSLN